MLDRMIMNVSDEFGPLNNSQMKVSPITFGTIQSYGLFKYPEQISRLTDQLFTD